MLRLEQAGPDAWQLLANASQLPPAVTQLIVRLSAQSSWPLGRAGAALRAAEAAGFGVLATAPVVHPSAGSGGFELDVTLLRIQ